MRLIPPTRLALLKFGNGLVGGLVGVAGGCSEMKLLSGCQYPNLHLSNLELPYFTGLNRTRNIGQTMRTRSTRSAGSSMGV